ncbi:hypothetical protein AAFF_G00032700 [Aldrovandia affinis]|uniref:Uncharacterized protein n=1 Tax=Aldrovandia affinis TaxID=143900 RepID=A0AAD7VY07_9TELE|nr:hypothetical protein AAFF_G00032700 [Aldrovandia affinis]
MTGSRSIRGACRQLIRRHDSRWSRLQRLARDSMALQLLVGAGGWSVGLQAEPQFQGRHKIQDLWMPVPFRVLAQPDGKKPVYTVAPLDGSQDPMNVHRMELRLCGPEESEGPGPESPGPGEAQEAVDSESEAVFRVKRPGTASPASSQLPHEGRDAVGSEVSAEQQETESDPEYQEGVSDSEQLERGSESEPPGEELPAPELEKELDDLKKILVAEKEQMTQLKDRNEELSAKLAEAEAKPSSRELQDGPPPPAPAAKSTAPVTMVPAVELEAMKKQEERMEILTQKLEQLQAQGGEASAAPGRSPVEGHSTQVAPEVVGGVISVNEVSCSSSFPVYSEEVLSSQQQVDPVIKAFVRYWAQGRKPGPVERAKEDSQTLELLRQWEAGSSGRGVFIGCSRIPDRDR